MIRLLSSLAIENHSKKLYGVQFHPEVDLTENGVVMMRNFLFKVSEIKSCVINLAIIYRYLTFKSCQ